MGCSTCKGGAYSTAIQNGRTMKRILSVLATASALACNVNAATLDWGNHSALEIGAASTPVGSFADTYLFSLTSAMSLSSSAVSNNLGSMLGLTGGTVTLFADVLGPDLKVGSYAFSGTTGSDSPAGAACTDDSTCQSDYCDGELKKCLNVCAKDSDCGTSESCRPSAANTPYLRCVPKP